MSNIIVFDTETIDVKNLDIFDFGFVVQTKTENIERSALIKSVYESEQFKNAYYYEKNSPIYAKLLEEGKIEMSNLRDERQALNSAIMDNEVRIIAGFVIDFDIRALNYNFEKYFGETKKITIDDLNRKRRVIDIGVLFGLIYGPRKDYKDFCMEHGFMTEKGNYKTTAEVMYRFITGNVEHTEQHTALSDSLEELEILNHLMINMNANENSPIFNKAVELTQRGTKAWTLLK